MNMNMNMNMNVSAPSLTKTVGRRYTTFRWEVHFQPVGTKGWYGIAGFPSRKDAQDHIDSLKRTPREYPSEYRIVRKTSRCVVESVELLPATEGEPRISIKKTKGAYPWQVIRRYRKGHRTRRGDFTTLADAIHYLIMFFPDHVNKTRMPKCQKTPS